MDDVIRDAYKGLEPSAGLSAYQFEVRRVLTPILAMTAVEFAAIGALLMFWCQGLSAGKR